MPASPHRHVWRILDNGLKYSDDANLVTLTQSCDPPTGLSCGATRVTTRVNGEYTTVVITDARGNTRSRNATPHDARKFRDRELYAMTDVARTRATRP